MNLLQDMKVLNLDAIPEDAIITATVDTGRLIMTKLQLFSRLGRRRGKRNPDATKPKATRVKSEKA